MIRYGFHGFHALRCMLEDELRQERYSDYLMYVQINTGRLLCGFMGGEWPMPDYAEYMYPGRKAKEPETYEDIKAHILKRLSE